MQNYKGGFGLTSADECVDVLDFPDRRVITVQHEGLHGVHQTIHVEDGAGIADPLLQIPKTAFAVVIGEAEGRRGKQSR